MQSCYTTSNNKNALAACRYYCGSYKVPAKIPLPSCKKDCYTTSEVKLNPGDKDALSICKKIV